MTNKLSTYFRAFKLRHAQPFRKMIIQITFTFFMFIFSKLVAINFDSFKTD